VAGKGKLHPFVQNGPYFGGKMVDNRNSGRGGWCRRIWLPPRLRTRSNSPFDRTRFRLRLGLRMGQPIFLTLLEYDPMKTNAILAGLLVSGLIGLSGCDQGAAPATPKKEEQKTSQTAPTTPPAVAAAPSAEKPADASNLVYVKLNVPNMT